MSGLPVDDVITTLFGQIGYKLSMYLAPVICGAIERYIAPVDLLHSKLASCNPHHMVKEALDICPLILSLEFTVYHSLLYIHMP